MNYAIETAILFSLGTPAAFIAGGFPIRQSLFAGVFTLVMVALFYVVSFVGHAL
jgi:hypothetical protein